MATWPPGELSIIFCFPGFPQWMFSLHQSTHHHGDPKQGEKEIGPNRLPPSSISSLSADEK